MVKLASASNVACLAISALLLIGNARGDSAGLAVNDKAPGLTLQADFPTTKLRGYGTVTGKLWVDGSGGSLLQIDCGDVEHARLVQAKYLSDLQELPPGTKSEQVDAGGAKISIQTGESVGAVAALRNGTTVVLAAAKTADALSKLITAGLSGDHAAWTSVAEGKVPMFLDRFDKYGFRFYYQPGNLKPGPNGREDPTYNPEEDFDYAAACNHAGILVWHGGQAGETAENMTKEPVWDWALRAAEKKNLSFGVNLGIESASFWYPNRHPEQMLHFAPGFLGTYYGSMNFGIGTMIAWSSDEAQDAMLGQLQGTVKRFKDTDAITSWLEPHEELGHGPADLLVDTGPGADANYRDYLRGKYQTIEALSKRWNGDNTLTSWDQVHVPEPADFLGWGPEAIDLAGTWRVSFNDADNAAALTPDFVDSGWGQMAGPGHGLARLLPQKPAVWRRHFNVDAAWLQKHPSSWLYVWDMNDTRAARKDPSQAVVVSVNGQTLPEKPAVYSECHWAGYDVSSALKPGDNVIAVRLPRGLFNYRTYLSGDEPKSYPELGEGRNAQWVDFSDWTAYVRARTVRRGMQMIRQVDPDRGIVLMAPDSFADDILQLAIEYGGDFHNTGYMGGWWCDRLPAMMRGAGLPFSVEPSQGPTLPAHLQGAFGNWITQGCNAIDNFQNMGEILWNPDLKQAFLDHVNMYTSIGKYHSPTAQVAALYSNRTNNLLGFPWNNRPATINGQPFFRSGGYPSTFNSRGLYAPMEHVPEVAFESDAVTEMMFSHHQVGKYKVIVDTNTSVLSDETLKGIEDYVRNGGVFVTCGETGRHSPVKPDSWPIDRLTGFHISGPQPGKGTLNLAGDQKVFPADWIPLGDFNGIKYAPSEPDAQNLLLWDDGTTAIGMRPLGKGFIVTVGPWLNGKVGNEFYAKLFAWLKIEPIPARLEAAEKPEIFWRHFIANNGLYDVWVVRNTGRDVPAEGTLVLADSIRPPWMIDLNSGAKTPVADGRLPIHLPPAEMAIYITPRNDVAGSVAEWFQLQRGWWQGSGDLGKPLIPQVPKISMDITDGWSLQQIDEAMPDVSALTAAIVDDKAWPKIELGIITLPDHPDLKRAIVRRHFKVPEQWIKGRVLLRLPEFREPAPVYLDGELLTATTVPELAPGSEHVLAIDITGKRKLLGTRSHTWLTYHPDPVAKQDLAGTWQITTDLLNWNESVAVPGTYPRETRGLRTSVVVDKAAAGKTTVLHVMQNSRQVGGVIINGNYLVPSSRESSELNLNITPWIKPGQENEFILPMGGSPETVNEVTLEFHEKGTYP